ncbi:Ubiquitin carboxyl-terminal hydrolase family protein [Leishmania donovani]|uniref:ubiquitinyl hydrolase 1 n=1 Tax=Leishmania donovani TaxID=5661 RepID=A0A504XV34_LEIDO|nr:Ubiquitin carboxyl-terminal hydrolase family protein [Leishmania donovani]
MSACVTGTAPAAQLGVGDLWASEVLEGCARAHYTPRQELLGILAPPPRSTAAGATPIASAVKASGATVEGGRTLIDVDAVQSMDGYSHAASPNSIGEAVANQPSLKPMERSALSEEMQALRAVLSPALIRKAYRLNTPCMTKHTTKNERLLNCTASPRCMAGLQLLGSDAATREDCLKALMGNGPYVVPLPAVKGSGVTAANADAASSSSASTGRERGGARATKSTREDLAETAGSATAAGDATEITVMSDPAFPCLWRGVRNLMNTCYFSAVLQLIFSIARVRHAILNDDAAAHDHYCVEIREAQGGTGVNQLAESGLKELFALMAFSREGAGADPKSFATYLSLDVKVQQDAQEFFTLLLDWLRCHCGPTVKAAVTSTFSGTLLYDRQCGSCGRSSKRAEPFLYLSLPVCPTLEDSLSEFSKPEAVDGFMCEQCGHTAVATSLQYMRTLPDVLVIHWNRFEFDLQSLQRHKVTTTTSFPLQLDMATYMRQWHEQKRNITSRAAGGESVAPEESEDHHLYELRGVVNHLGDTAVSGHYTYHGKVSGASAEPGSSGGSRGSSWLNFNDAEVSKLNRYQGQRGASPDAYLLVYHRIATSCSSPRSTSVSAPPSTGKPPQLQPVAAVPSTSATPTPAEYPVYLRQYVDRVNDDCLTKRHDWMEQRAQAAALFDLWATAAKAVFESATNASSAPAWISTTTTATPSLYVLPTRWLQHFGRFFLPAYVDAAALGSGAESKLKRSKRDLDAVSGPAGDSANSALASGAAGVDGKPIVVGPEEGASGSGASAAVEGTVVTATVGPLRHGHMQTAEEVRQQVRQYSLMQALPSVTCAHGCVLPWASYKVVSASAYEKLSRFLAVCGSPLTVAANGDRPASPSTPEAPMTARLRESMAGGGAACGTQSCCTLMEANLCPLCVAAMAAGVQALASRTTEDEEAEIILTRAWEEAERRKRHAAGEEGDEGDSGAGPGAVTPTALTQSTQQQEAEEKREDGQQQRVLVSKTVVEAWASFYTSQLGWGRVRQAEGYTGVLTVSTSLAKADHPFSLAALDVDRGDLNLSAQLLCPHGALRPGQSAVAIPDSLRRYWVHRFVEVLTMAHRSGVLRTSNPHWSVNEDDVEHFFLPLIPASETSTTCQECMQSSVQHLTSRHQQRMKRMEERKRYPSLWLAGAMTCPSGVAQLLLATGAENEEQLLAAQHPNRLFFKQHGEREYREYVKKWAEAHQQRVAHQSSEVQRLRTALMKKRQHDAAWNARVTMRRSGGGRSGGRGASATNVPSSPVAPAPSETATAAAAPPEPQTLEGRLYYAEEALEKMTAQTVPDCTVTYGCVPTWWVARWYAAMQSEDNKSDTSKGGDDADGEPLLVLPRISFEKFKCAHSESLLEVSWLNPSDGFWQGARAKRAELLWNGVRVERAGAPTPTSPPTGPTEAEYRSQCWLPPMVILPMDEYVALLAQYGEPGMLERVASRAGGVAGTSTAGAAVGGDCTVASLSTPSPPAATPVPKSRAQTVPVAAAVIQVRFHNGARQLWPSTCAQCCAAMLAKFDAQCESFVNGSLRLNIHVKKSRKNYYDAVSVLTSAAVQHTGSSAAKSVEGGSNTTATDADVIPAGIHYYTTLRQLKIYISAHLREKHGYLVPAEVLQIGRGKNKPLKRCSTPPHAVEESGHHTRGTAPTSATAAEVAQLDEATLQELGIRDGETLSVQSVDIIAQTCATTAAIDEEWEAIPPELLQAGACGDASAASVVREHTVAFRETRLQGSHGGSIMAASPAVTAAAAGVVAAGPTVGAAIAMEEQGLPFDAQDVVVLPAVAQARTWLSLYGTCCTEEEVEMHPVVLSRVLQAVEPVQSRPRLSSGSDCALATTTTKHACRSGEGDAEAATARPSLTAPHEDDGSKRSKGEVGLSIDFGGLWMPLSEWIATLRSLVAAVPLHSLSLRDTALGDAGLRCLCGQVSAASVKPAALEAASRCEGGGSHLPALSTLAVPPSYPPTIPGLWAASTLRLLDLSGAALTDGGPLAGSRNGPAIAALAELIPLRRLDLSHNLLGTYFLFSDAMMTHRTEAGRSNAAPEYDMASSAFRHVGFHEAVASFPLVTALYLNNTLIELNLRNNGLPIALLEYVEAKLHVNQRTTGGGVDFSHTASAEIVASSTVRQVLIHRLRCTLEHILAGTANASGVVGATHTEPGDTPPTEVPAASQSSVLPVAERRWTTGEVSELVQRLVRNVATDLSLF